MKYGHKVLEFAFIYLNLIVRNYITCSLWREYSSGINGQYGFILTEGLKKDQKFSK